VSVLKGRKITVEHCFSIIKEKITVEHQNQRLIVIELNQIDFIFACYVEYIFCWII